mmetsp:Transcript_17725/g.50486  ORF Transcript_17725/g.50486 Transcript_17725/m.50486 type:complete len:352 (-) Transcript_17725:1259-2314(-)
MGLVLIEEQRLQRPKAAVQDGGDQDRRHRRDFWQRRGRGAVVRDREHRHIVQQREEDHVERGHRVLIAVDHDGEHEHDLDRRGDAVEHVGPKACEDLPRLDHGVEDHGEARRCEDHVRRRTRGLRGTIYGDADLRLGEGRGVVHAVAGHADDEASVLEDQDDLPLVLRENLRKPVGRQNGLVPAGGCGPEVGGREDRRAEPDEAASLDGDVEMVPGHHLDVDAGLPDAVDREPRVLPRRVDHRHHGRKLHGAPILRHSHADGLVALRGEAQVDALDLLLDHAGEGAFPTVTAIVPGPEDLVHQALRNLQVAPRRVRAIGDRALHRRVEADEGPPRVLAEQLLGAGGAEVLL